MILKVNQMETMPRNLVRSWLLLLLVDLDCDDVDIVQYYNLFGPNIVKTVVDVCGDMIITVHGLGIVWGREITGSFGVFF